MTIQTLLHVGATGHTHFELIAAFLAVASVLAFGAAWRKRSLRRSSLRK